MGFPSRPSERTGPADPLISALLPPEPEMANLLFKALRVGCFVNPGKATQEGFLLLKMAVFPYDAAR